MSPNTQNTDTACPFHFISADYPATPGVYLMKDDAGKILYVGKAKSLRSRLSSYFGSRTGLTPKTRALVARVRAVEILLTSTEKEALLLEASLIKKHRPRYNVVLRDDKSYVLFRLDRRSEYPRLSMTRKVVRDGSVYYGPFTSAAAARTTWKLLGKVFPLRKCSDANFRNRVRPCLYYDIKQCLGPCVYDVDRNVYDGLVRQVEMLLSGRSGELRESLTGRMKSAAANLEFERAAMLRDQIRAVEQTVERQSVVLRDHTDRDVLGLAENESGLGLGLLFVRQGRLLDHKTFFWPGLTLEEGPEVLHSFISQFYHQARFIPSRLVAPFETDEVLAELLADRRRKPMRIAPPSDEAESRLLAIAKKHALQGAPKKGEEDVTVLLAQKLRLPAPPERIECVDASHLAGQGMRVGQVVFEHGRHAPDASRIYSFPELEGAADDYAALAGWARRRVASGPPYPDLVLIDGGRAQLAAVGRALEDALADTIQLAADGQYHAPRLRADERKSREEETSTRVEGLSDDMEGDAFSGGGRSTPVESGPEGTRSAQPGDASTGGWQLASIAKGPSRRAGELEDRIFRPGRSNPLPLRPGSPELLFLQRVRDTAHRFVIGRQRTSRKKRVLQSELLAVPGIGPKTARLLWDRFGSLDAMLAAGPEDIESVEGIGRKKAALIHAALGELRVARSSGSA